MHGQVNGALSNTTIRPIEPDQRMCIHAIGDKAFKAVSEARVQPLFAQAIAVASDTGAGTDGDNASKRVVILVNTWNCSAQVSVEGAMGGTVRVVDLEAGYETTPYREHGIPAMSDALELGGFAVALVTLPPSVRRV